MLEITMLYACTMECTMNYYLAQKATLSTNFIILNNMTLVTLCLE